MRNTYFKKNIDNYAEEIMSIQPTFYKNSAKIINKFINSGDYVIDVGNGGVINYNLKPIESLICADLEYNELAVERYKLESKVKFIEADVLKMDEFVYDKFDIVILQTVIHHLAGKTYKETEHNTLVALKQCLKVLKRNGKLIIVESTVEPWFEMIERCLYLPMQLFFCITKFGYTYQYSKTSLIKLVKTINDINVLEYGKVDIGKSIWVMGKKIFRKFTPLGASYIIIEKLENITDE